MQLLDVAWPRRPEPEVERELVVGVGVGVDEDVVVGRRVESRLPGDPRDRLHGDNEDNVAGLVGRLERVHVVDVQPVVHADTRGITMIGGLDGGQLRRER